MTKNGLSGGGGGEKELQIVERLIFSKNIYEYILR